MGSQCSECRTGVMCSCLRILSQILPELLEFWDALARNPTEKWRRQRYGQAS